MRLRKSVTSVSDYDRMAIGMFREPVDQIDNTIFQAADVEAKHHVRDQRTGVTQVVV